ncbi:MAG: hypothetical protein MJ151_01025, partial [Lachnospiraceae bacterium]|nr:hypothetical protein [Lachnospiraceae bacterium]
MAISILFCILSFVINKKSIFYKDNIIKRSGYGDGKTNYSINIDVEKDIKDEIIRFFVSDKRYKESEISEIFEYAFDECVCKVLGKNRDFSHIDTDLYFFSTYKEGIDIVWDFKLKDSDDIEKIKKYYGLVEDNGKLNNQLI